MIKNKIYIHFVIVLLIFFNCILFVSCKKENYNEKSYSYVIDDEIKYIDLEWNIGDIDIVSGDKFLIEEVSINEKGIAPLKYSINNQRLIVNYNDSKKKLKITLDKNKEYIIIEIKSVMTNIRVNQIKLNYLNVNLKRGVTNITFSSIDYVDIDIECSKEWPLTNISNNNFNIFYMIVQNVTEITFEKNTSKSCIINTTTGNIIYKKNQCKNINIKTIYGNLFFHLYLRYGYKILSNSKKIYIDFETISYYKTYLINNGEINITCESLRGVINITRDSE